MPLDVNDEWHTPITTSPQESAAGQVPTFVIHKDSIAQFKHSFDAASKLARQGERRRIAILCMDPERFDAYLVAASGQYKNEYITIASQDDLIDTNYSRNSLLVCLSILVGFNLTMS
jgi:hypothetical protein